MQLMEEAQGLTTVESLFGRNSAVTMTKTGNDAK